MSYKAANSIKTTLELDMLEQMELSEINHLLNKLYDRITELEEAGAKAAMYWSDAQNGYQCPDLIAFREAIGQLEEE